MVCDSAVDGLVVAAEAKDEASFLGGRYTAAVPAAGNEAKVPKRRTSALR